jgi:hypothetical protein
MRESREVLADTRQVKCGVARAGSKRKNSSTDPAVTVNIEADPSG